MISSAKWGKGRLFFVKLVVAALTYSLIYTLIYLPYTINFIKTFGTDIFAYPLVFLDGFQNLDSTITMSGAIILESVTHMALGVAICSFVLFLSQKLKNNITAMVVSTSVTLLPCMLVCFNEELRIFSLMTENKLWLMTAMILASLISALIFSVLVYRSFIKKPLRGRK